MNPDQERYKPLSKAAMRRILRLDQERGHGVGGIEPNRTRFYIYLTQNKSDVEVRTIAVKAKHRSKEPLLKEVALASVDDPEIHVKDLAHHYIAGYSVDWTPEGFRGREYGYKGKWESEDYAYRCMWKLWAPVVNPELLLRTRRFKYCAWNGSQGKPLDYLKTYAKHPEIELLVKAGLGHYATKISVVRRLKKNKAFRQFFMQHAEEIKRRTFNIDVINKAFSMGVSFVRATIEIQRRSEFKWVNLPHEVNAVHAYEYVLKHDLTLAEYAAYMQNCKALKMDLSDTKVCHPKQFKRRANFIQKKADVLRRLENAKKYADMNNTLAAIADTWAGLMKARGRYRIVIPRNVDEFIDEGKAMGNCLDQTYAANVAEGNKLIVFVRKAKAKDEAFVAAEYHIENRKVTQCYEAKNQKPAQEVIDYIEKRLAKVASELSKPQLKKAA